LALAPVVVAAVVAAVVAVVAEAPRPPAVAAVAAEVLRQPLASFRTQQRTRTRRALQTR
jgi:hypothetical protein